MEKRLSKATLALLFLSIITFAAMTMPAAKAVAPSISLSPSQGPAGTTVIISLTGYPAPNPVSITLGTANFGTAYPQNVYGVNTVTLNVPQVSPGTYPVTATGTQGQFAITTFTVTQSVTHSTPLTTYAGLSPTNNPVTVHTASSSPLTIVIISAVIAFAVLMTAIIAKRSKQKASLEQEPLYEPRPSTLSNKPTGPSKVYQSSKVYQPSTIYKPAANSQQAPFTKICRHCKRSVRDDLNVCPYCSKRLR
jgi:hypothetical protein